jgi:glycosyltransferase involved in cell wall biosynthesis
MPEPPALPPIAQAPISVILPVQDHPAVLDDWLAYLNALGRDFEIIVVADRDQAATGEQAAQVRILRQELRGIGAALRTGIEAARYPLLAYAEASPAFSPAELKKFLDEIDRVHIASGERMISGRRQPRTLKERLFQIGARMFFGVRLKDVECPFKLFRREIFARIPIQSDGPFVHAEIVAKANFLGHMMIEIPVTVTPRVGSRSRYSLRERCKDAFRVFHKPDFGPAVLPAENPGQDQAQDVAQDSDPGAVCQDQINEVVQDSDPSAPRQDQERS